MPQERIRRRLPSALLVLLIVLSATAVAAGAGWVARSNGDALEREVWAIAGGRGVSVAVTMTRGGVQPLRSVSIGLDAAEPVPIGSARKWLASAAILTLVEEGLVDLDRPVADWLPLYDQPYKDRITLRMLLAHTSGMVGRPPDGLCSGAGTLGGCVDRLAGVPLVSEPGTTFSYSSAGYNVAARVAEVASGEGWRDLLEDRVLRPLDMNDVVFEPAGPGLPDMVGDVRVSTRSYVRFLAMVLDGGSAGGEQLLAAESIEEMVDGQTGSVPKIGAIPKKSWWPQGYDYYGLGMWRNVLDDQGRAEVVTSEGRHGFMAWIDWRNHTAGAASVRSGRVAGEDRSLERVPRIDRLGAAFLANDQPSRNLSGSSAWRPSSL